MKLERITMRRQKPTRTVGDDTLLCSAILLPALLRLQSLHGMKGSTDFESSYPLEILALEP
jgi:hypothetical protein